MVRIVDAQITTEEAMGLMDEDELAAHATQERFIYYHRWRAGDYRPDERRIMLRTIVYPN